MIRHVCVHLWFSAFVHRCCCNMCSITSYLQGFPLTVEQLGDVPCHSLHQVLGVVSLDFKLALLFIINLQMENIQGIKHQVTRAISLINKITEELFAYTQGSVAHKMVDIYCRAGGMQPAIIPISPNTVAELQSPNGRALS